MKHATTALVGLTFVVALACAPGAEAGMTLRADLPCPYGPGGGDWSPTTNSTAYNSGISTPYTIALAAGSGTNHSDEYGVAFDNATQYDVFASAIPPASACPGANPSGPETQVIVYNLTQNASLGLAKGDTEVEFNYNTPYFPGLGSTASTASFTMAGVTYSSVGPLLPAFNDNDFVFDSSGKLLGSFSLSSSGIVSGTPTGWTTSGGGGTVTAPEMDTNSAMAAFTLLAGGLAVMRGTRRTRKPLG